MPFGTKPGPDGGLVNFNRVYNDLIRPALEQAGLLGFRADEERQPGDIRVDMFQELLIADLVVVDLTFDDPNVWYELGMRHALRARGVLLISGGHSSKAFDVYTNRKLRYELHNGGPNPATLDDDIGRLSQMIMDTMESWHGRSTSPVYQLIPSLSEPDWRKLQVGNLGEFWEAYDAWEQRIVAARRQGRVGDMLVLADEAPVAAFRASAWIRAGKALRRAGQYEFALEQLDKGLAIEPLDSVGLREKGICLQRLAARGRHGFSLDRARAHYRAMLQRDDQAAETWALLGRVEKDAWTLTWRLPEATQEQRLAEARYWSTLLREAIDCYLQAFRTDPKHYYSGINALTLMHLYCHLMGSPTYRDEIDVLPGAVRFAAQCEQDPEKRFWSHATLGELQVLMGTPQTAEAAYKEAVAADRDNRFALESTREQLLLLRELALAPGNADAAIAVFDRILQRMPSGGVEWQPRRVLLFSGHMVDAPDRATPRFPEHLVERAAQRIADLLRDLEVGPDDLALTQGACGGDLLFSEACLTLGARLSWLQPFAEPDFIRASVVNCDEQWRPRYLAARAQLTGPILAAPQELGEPPRGAGDSYPYARCNLWLLNTALAWGVERVHFVCLWNGAGGDGSGGTAHMYHEVAKRTGQVHWIDTRQL